MYHSITLIVLSIIAVSEGCRPPPCHWNDAKPIEDYFNQVANVMIAADRQAQSFCSQGSSNVRELHSPTQYQLVYPSVDGDAFDIKVRDRVLLIRAHSCSGSVADVKILPPYVNAQAGSYTVDAGDLVIHFPYKFNPSMGGGSCIPPNPSIISLPQGCTLDNCNNKIY